MSKIFNPHQQQAIDSSARFLMVLAGAGSGKTSVLAERIRTLIVNHNVHRTSCLVITFTQKAARAIRLHLQTALSSIEGLWVGTFHAIGYRIIHQSASSQPMVVCDADDQLKWMKKALKSLSTQTQYTPKHALQCIQSYKEAGYRPHTLPHHHRDGALHRELYERYEALLLENNCMDFSELMLRSYELLNDPPIQQHYWDKFRYIFVDEFQDTNRLQYDWLHRFIHHLTHVTVVGDDDQSIYGWRGACVENIKSFLSAHPEASLIRLEQNYRSSGIILQAANAVIANNRMRLGKSLWTQQDGGPPITLYAAKDAMDEANRIVTFAKTMSHHDMAILYRNNHQANFIESALSQAHIPYHLHSGSRFFSKTNVKHVLLFFRFVANVHDNAAFLGLTCLLTKGVGDKTMQTLLDQASDKSVWWFLNNTPETAWPKRALRALQHTLQWLMPLSTLDFPITPDSLLHMILKIGQQAHVYYPSDDAFFQDDSVINILKQMLSVLSPMTPTDMMHWLNHLLMDDDTLPNNSVQKIQLMTIHAAKGLEFDIVWLCGLESGIFPSNWHVTDAQFEEERRLFYVAITRAKKHLYLSYSRYRSEYGAMVRTQPSEFLREIPTTLLQDDTS
jgi:DNA helicase II / ATP-dependent DNA helicase PcrA